MTSHEDEIEVLVSSEVDTDDDAKSIFAASGTEFMTRMIPVETLRTNMQKTINMLGTLLVDTVDPPIPKFQISEMQVNLEINAKGAVRLIGSAELGGKSAITVVVKRCDTS
jgi:hypothetical protein